MERKRGEEFEKKDGEKDKSLALTRLLFYASLVGLADVREIIIVLISSQFIFL